ncbi:tripartite tricarboxylate transporter substrate binding protein [Ottowia caeni]|uniref:Bug family tripartite tricarboxylate transporter substrate binding protein n=1 Tax=Ottowia caeni TaxID=2870339 RepID=UPI001E333C18|nr:tripartite tricarboxylate transporter substrate binding protein [Ottowia caeni]
MVKRRQLMHWMGSSMAAGIGLPAWAQGVEKPAGFPTKPLRIVVPFPPGGPADALARPMAQMLGDRIGQPVIIENKPGANTMIGASYVLAAPADGYTILMANEAGLALAPAIAPVTKVDVPYDPGKDFVGGALLAQYGSILSVAPDVPVKTLPEFIAHARKNPGKLSYASFGIGSQPHIMMELLNREARIETVHVPYKGVAPATLDLMAGRVQAMISAPSGPLPHIRAGKLRAIAYSGSRRLAQLPELPTFAQGELPSFEARGWFGLVMNSATPEPVLAWLSEQIWAVVQSPEYQQNAIGKNGLEVPSVDPSKMSAFLADDRRKWKTVVDELKARLV